MLMTIPLYTSASYGLIQEAILTLVAPFVGSFLGVITKRLPDERDWRWGRSTCDTCHKRLSPVELVPILSWLVLHGRCRNCHAEIGFFYPAIELAALAIAVWTVVTVPHELQIVTTLFGWLLLTLAAVDWQTRRLPDVLTLLLAITGLVAAYLYDRDYWLIHAAAGVAAAAALVAIAVLYRWIRKSAGLGLGDAKLFGALGIWVSLSGLPSVLFLGAMFAMAFYLIRQGFLRTDWRERLPFGPFLAAAGWLVWLYGALIPALRL